MTREIIISELVNKGYNAEAVTTIKNGVAFDGIRIMANAKIAPVIYTDEILKRAEEEEQSIEEVVNGIIAIYEANRSIDFDIEEIFEKEFLLNHIFIGLQKESDEKIIKRNCDFDGIESYIYIRKSRPSGESYSLKLNPYIMEKTNVTEKELWQRAEQNTNEEATLQSMANIIAEMLHIEDVEELEAMNPMYVVSNKNKVKGASAVLNKEILAEFGRKFHTDKIVVLPSSIHEMILVPYTEEINLENMTAMVKEINTTEVRPEERLTDKAYIVTL